MFQMNYHIPDCSPIPVKNYSKMTIDEIYNYIAYDANFVISYNDSVFFSESIAIVEFYWFVCNWYNKIKAGMNIPFQYNTIEHKVPILIFYSEGDNWKIDSIWKCEISPIRVNKIDFMCEIDRFINNMKLYLEPQKT